jgi:hypothetical protein
MNSEKHTNRFIHPCPFGINCKNREELHLMQFDHNKEVEYNLANSTTAGYDSPSFRSYTRNTKIDQKKRCPAWLMCKQTGKSEADEAHKNEYFHPCSMGINCKNGNEVHINRFVHPCVFGDNCVNQDRLHRIQYHSI